MEHRLAWLLATITLCTLCTTALAATAVERPTPLTVVADHGGQPARPYYVPIAAADVQEDQGFTATPQARRVTEADMLPVASDHLSVGRVAPRELDLPPSMTPVFLVGADPKSARWLQQRGSTLRALGAVGLVINVENAADLLALRQQASGLILYPVSGDDLARRLGLTHYPVLITSSRLEQ